MNNLSQADIEELVRQRTELEVRRLRVESRRDLDLEPHVARHIRATKSIHETAERKLSKLTPKIEELTEEIDRALLAGVDVTTGVIAIPQVSVQVGKVTAIAEVKSKDGARVIDPQRFFSHTPPAKRVKAFWECVKIGIKPATEFFGELVLNSMADKPTTYKVEHKLSE